MTTINIGLYAQEKVLSEPSGILRGYIYAQNGKAIGGATIKIIDTDYTCSSGHSGYFRFKELPIKRFQIEVSKDGYYMVTEKVFATAQGYRSYDIMLLSKNKYEYTRSCWAKTGFSWRKNPEPDLAGYKIYRSDKPLKGNLNIELIKTLILPEETTFIDTSPLIGDNYYCITAFDTFGLESAASRQIYFYIAPCRYGRYTVVDGDWLCTIAAKHNVYNDCSKWHIIYEANKDKIKDPNLIFSGWVLLIPNLDRYIVKPGDYLALIASYISTYSDASRWPEIYEVNKDKIEYPNLIYPKQELIIPSE